MTPRQVHVDVVGGDPLGRGDAPALSWWLPDGAAVQQAYRIRTDDGYDSGVVNSDAQTLVTLPGFDRSPRVTAAQVMVTTDPGESGWSEPVPLRSGLLQESDWTASWVGPDDPEPGPKGERPAYWLRAAFAVGRPGATWLHVTSLGLHEVWLNGERVGDVELAPGYTQYRRRVQGLSYDVSDLVLPGPNVAFLYDVLGFSRSWLRDVELDQRTDGCVPGISPSSPIEGFDGPVGMLNGSASPGYRTFRVRPTPGGGLTHADLRLDSPYGPIVVAWRLVDGELRLDLEVPPGTTAEVWLPDGTLTTVGPGEHAWPGGAS